MKSKIGVIAGILVIRSIFFSCATNTEIGFNVTAKGTSKGIELYFENMPEDIDRVFVLMFDDTAKNVTKMFADIRGNELEEIKQSGIIICPFVETGHEYTIFVSFHTGEGYKQVAEHIVNSTAEGGIHLTNSLSLNWNSENNNVTLSALPIFSEDVIYYHTPDFIEYMLMVRPPLEQTSDRLEMYIWENWERSYTVSRISNELTFDLYPFKNQLKEDLDLTDDFSTSTFAYSNLTHGNINWWVGIAKSEDFIISF
jgi:hypothetical protein